LYAQAEKSAASYDPLQAAPGPVPAAAWALIRDWEESGLESRSEADVLSDEFLIKLMQLLKERRGEIEKFPAAMNEKRDLVPVIVVDQAAEFRAVEVFERRPGPPGTETLVHIKGSERFDAKPLHAVVDLGPEGYSVVSKTVRRSTIRLEYNDEPREKTDRTGYFIVED
jgi:hypothetical protein